MLRINISAGDFKAESFPHDFGGLFGKLGIKEDRDLDEMCVLSFCLIAVEDNGVMSGKKIVGRK